MKRLLLSILSDYLQPNFLLIKEFYGKYDELVFVTTEGMELKRKSNWLEKALGLGEDSVRRIIVVEDDFEGIKERLRSENFSADDEYILNITGGTKIMPLAVYDFFKTGYRSEFFYVPIGKNVIKSISSQKEQPLTYRINLGEYFTLNGLRCECDNSLYQTQEFTSDLFARLKRAKFNRYKVAEIRDAQTLPKSEDRAYYGGRWFEEYCYCRLKREFKLTDDAIGKSAAIYREGSQSNDNEIDVLFVKDNMLYIFECKVGMIGNNSPKETIEQYQYKLAAIAKDFGLKVEAYILTLHKIFNNKTFSDSTIANIRKRQSILGLRGIIDSSAFAQTTPLIENYARQTTRQDTKTTPIKEVGKVATGEPIKEKPAERQDFIETVIPSISLKIIGKIEL